MHDHGMLLTRQIFSKKHRRSHGVKNKQVLHSLVASMTSPLLTFLVRFDNAQVKIGYNLVHLHAFHLVTCMVC